MRKKELEKKKGENGAGVGELWTNQYLHSAGEAEEEADASEWVVVRLPQMR